MKNKFIYFFTISILLGLNIFPYSNSFAQETISMQNNTENSNQLLKEKHSEEKQSLKERQCNTIKDFAERVIDRISYCDVDEECKIMNFGCPFGCNSLVNKHERINIAQEAVATYVNHCSQCMYECIQELRKPKCIFGKCRFE